MIHVIVDAYNLIRQVPALLRHERKSLEDGRKNLIRLLANYRKIKRHKISVVFDGMRNISEFGPAYKEAGLYIIFSPQTKNADEIIKEMVRQEKDRALVVTSDRAIINYAIKEGAGVIDSPEFYDKLIMADLMGDLDKDLADEKSTVQHKRWATYKKGPSRRVPKKERKSRQRIKKL